MAFRTRHAGPLSVALLDDGAPVCEIQNLMLQNARFRPGGRVLIGGEVPLPLFWEQYANHEHPGRNAGSHGSLQVLHQSDEKIAIECRGMTDTGEAASRYLLSLVRLPDPPRYVYEVQAFLSIPQLKSWLVTPNHRQGELEFCNFWADGVFSSNLNGACRYRGCYLVHGEQVTMIPHHHLESADKHNLLLDAGDRMAWLLEDENPVIEVLSGDPVTAGICAYMWDAHLAVKACHEEKARILPEGTSVRAHFRLFSIDRKEGQRLVDLARVAVAPETYQTPIIVGEVNTFAETLATTRENPADVWPWEQEAEGSEAADIRLFVDRVTGYDDGVSLCIESTGPIRAAWKATTFGPAFRQAPFPDGGRYSASSFVRTRLTYGVATVALRLHRKGQPGLFDPSTYEVYRSAPLSGISEWAHLEVVTPPISPAPDRVHLLLEMNGTGRCWFDNVRFLRNT
jgi:hypothetical protein